MITILSLTACSSNDEKTEPAEIEGCEVSVIADSEEITEDSFTEKVWESVSRYAAENSLGADCFRPEKSSEKAYMAAIQSAVDRGAGLIVLPGSCFEETAYKAQKKYKDIRFLLMDGVPHNSDDKYKTTENTISIVFAEEEAGYLAGYAAVKDGCTSAGFIGEKNTPEIKRYGYGFVQGAAAAAEETESKVSLKHEYESTSEKVGKLASEWYGSGVQVVFVCGDDIVPAVIGSAEAANGRVICADTDKSHLSETVMTSAVKSVDAAVEDVIDGYADDKFIGGTAFNYAVKNNGIMLEMDNARFTLFDNEQYDTVMDKLRNGKVELKKDKKVKSVSELEDKWISIE